MKESSSKTKQKKKSALLISLTIFAISLALNLSFTKIFILDADEAHLVRKTMAVMSGKLPLVDFTFFTYQPGIYFLLASFFYLFSPSLIVERSFWVVFRCFNNVLTYLVAKRIMPTHFALIPVAVIALVPCIPYKSFYTLFVLINLYMLFLYIEKFETKWLLVSGLVTGLTFWFRQDVGGFSALIFGICIFLHNVSHFGSCNIPAFSRFKKFFGAFGKSIGMYTSMVILGFSPLLIYYSLHSKAHDLLYQTAIGRPTEELEMRASDSYYFPNFSEIFHIPIQWDVVFLWFPIFLFISVLFLLIFRRIKRKSYSRENLCVFFTLLMAFFTFYQTYNYPKYERILENGVTIYILTGYIIPLMFSSGAKRFEAQFKRRSLGFVFKTLLISTLLLFPAWFTYYGLTQRSVNDRLMAQRDNDVIKSSIGVWLPKKHIKRRIRKIVQFTRERAKEGEQILIFQSSLVYFYANQKDLERMNISIKHFSEKSFVRDMRKLNPKFVAVENWAFYSLDRLPKPFHVWFARKYRRILHRGGYYLYVRKKNR